VSEIVSHHHYCDDA